MLGRPRCLARFVATQAGGGAQLVKVLALIPALAARACSVDRLPHGLTRTLRQRHRPGPSSLLSAVGWARTARAYSGNEANYRRVSASHAKACGK
jgi:hypothetical protein